MKRVVQILFMLISLTPTSAQVLAGVGFSDTQLSEKALDDAAGFALLLEKDFNLSKSTRWKMHPGLHVSFLFSANDRTFEPLYLNIISFSPKVSYEVIANKKVKIAPYGSPFVSFLLGLQSGDPAFESESIDEFKTGFEVGVRVDLTVSKTTIRIIPTAAQFGRSFYRQGMISLLIGL